MLYIISYLLFMIPTYLWRYAFITDAMNNNAMQNPDITALNICFLINYIILLIIAYYRSKKIEKPILAVFPLIAGIFDIVLGFIPLVPTAMNITALIMGAQNKQDASATNIVKKETNLDKLEKLANLKEKGVISEEEFANEKEKLMKNM